jgi:hypothetical protein
MTNLYRKPLEKRLSILAIGARQCRWPVADDASVIGGIICCGAETDTTYCATHRQLSYADRQNLRSRGQSALQTRTPNTLIGNQKVAADAVQKAA